MQILPFTFNQSKIRTVLDKNFNIWFIANDIATMLVYKRPSEAISQHCKNVITQNEFQKLHGKLPYSLDSRLKLIPESDVWRLIIKSKLPNAERIEKWIMEDVLPQIRKTGLYSIPQTFSNPKELKEKAEKIEISTNMFQNFENIFSRIGIVDKTELAITSNRAVEIETGIDFIKLADKRGLATSDIFFTPTELAELSKNSEVLTKIGKGSGRKMNQELGKAGFQIWTDKVWIQTESGKEFSKLVQNKSPYSTKTVYHLNWKKEILEKLDFEKKEEISSSNLGLTK